MIRSPLFRLGMLAVVMAVSVMALFHLGRAGTLLFQAGVWCSGQLSWVLWTAGIVLPGWLFWTGHRDPMPRRFWIGLGCLASGLALFFTALSVQDARMVWQPLQVLFQTGGAILQGTASSAGGLLGSLLYGLSAGLFSRTGAFVASALLVFLSAIPLLYEPPEKLKGSLEKRRSQRAAFRAAMAEDATLADPGRTVLWQEDTDDGTRARPGSLDGRRPRRRGMLGMLSVDDVQSGRGSRTETEQKAAGKKRTLSVPIVEAGRMLDVIDDQEPQLYTGIDIRAEDVAAGSGSPQDSVSARKEEVRSGRKKAEVSRVREAVSAPKPADEKTEEKKLSPVRTVARGKEETASPSQLPDGAAGYAGYTIPKLSLLDPVARRGKGSANRSYAREQGEKLIRILREFNVEASLTAIHIGPSVTRFEVRPDMGVRVSRISNLQNDIQMALGATDIRIEAPIPGKSAVGIEIPNAEKTAVQMKELMAAVPEDLKGQKLLFALGKDLQGDNIFGRLDRMPHLLIAGATGSGKSVCVNSIICSLLMRTQPDDVKLILVDPKKVEFTPYAEVPHLLAPVITDSELANKALKVVVEMMDHRYDLFGLCGVRNITAYNAYLETHPEEHLKPLPRIVVIIDELADLMLAGAKEVEQSIQRITQLARAAGIHLIVATQRPSVDVITGVIKANIPSRIAFAVSSAVDSRTILDQTGAERLLGYGDMLYLPNGETSATRVQGVFIKDEEVNRVSDYVKTQGRPQYDDAFITLRDLQSQGGQVSPEAADPLYNDVKRFVVQTRKASTSLIQRRFSIGYARAARLMDVLEVNGIIGPSRGSKPREVLVEQNTEDSKGPDA